MRPVQALAELNIKEQNIIGLAKQQEEIYLPDKKQPVLLSRRNQGLHLLQHARNEAHRFAVTFHRKKRTKRTLRSAFDDLPGVGPSRRKALATHFGSYEMFKESSLADLGAVPGISMKLAEKLFAFVRNQST